MSQREHPPAPMAPPARCRSSFKYFFLNYIFKQEAVTRGLITSPGQVDLAPPTFTSLTASQPMGLDLNVFLFLLCSPANSPQSHFQTGSGGTNRKWRKGGRGGEGYCKLRRVEANIYTYIYIYDMKSLYLDTDIFCIAAAPAMSLQLQLQRPLVPKPPCCVSPAGGATADDVPHHHGFYIHTYVIYIYDIYIYDVCIHTHTHSLVCV